jgi:hypothetical protein
MKKHSFLISVAAAASALTGVADANVQAFDGAAVKSEGPADDSLGQAPLAASEGARVYQLGDELHSFLMKPSERGQLLAYHQSHYSHSSHSSHRSSY